MHLWKKREVVKMGIKIGLSEKLGYKQASKPEISTTDWV